LRLREAGFDAVVIGNGKSLSGGDGGSNTTTTTTITMAEEELDVLMERIFQLAGGGHQVS